MKEVDLEEMSVDERLQMMEALWASFGQESALIESPSWHGEILAQRKAKLESGEAKFISIETLKVYYVAKS